MRHCPAVVAKWRNHEKLVCFAWFGSWCKGGHSAQRRTKSDWRIGSGHRATRFPRGNGLWPPSPSWLVRLSWSSGWLGVAAVRAERWLSLGSVGDDALVRARRSCQSGGVFVGAPLGCRFGGNLVSAYGCSVGGLPLKAECEAWRAPPLRLDPLRDHSPRWSGPVGLLLPCRLP